MKGLCFLSIVAVVSSGCSTVPRPTSFQASIPSQNSAHTFIATTTIPDKTSATAEIYSPSGASLGMYGVEVEHGVLTLQTDLPPGKYQMILFATGCLKYRTEISIGVPATTTNISPVFGDIDEDEKVTERDIKLFRRWKGRKWRDIMDSESDKLLAIKSSNGDFDRDGVISQAEVDLAQSNVGR